MNQQQEKGTHGGERERDSDRRERNRPSRRSTTPNFIPTPTTVMPSTAIGSNRSERGTRGRPTAVDIMDVDNVKEEERKRGNEGGVIEDRRGKKVKREVSRMGWYDGRGECECRGLG